MINAPRHIDLHLPVGWNRCSTDELEVIASAIINEQQNVGRYHPFNWSRVKLNVVLSVNDITILSANHLDGNGNEQSETWTVQRQQDKEPWTIGIGQLADLCERMNWLTDENAGKVIFRFPYPELTLVQGSGFRVQGSKPLTINREPLTVTGPPPLLDGYTWREYRWLTDWMQAYMRHANMLLQVKSAGLREKNMDAMEQARNEFLAVLFKPADNSQLPTLNSQLFTDFDAVKWQVILFWWSSLMSQLAKKFPKVFKQQPVGKDKARRRQQQDTPWDFYNRVTATIQKYIGGLSEQDVNNASYGTILQQLEMMADEAAEMEKIKRKK